MNGRHLLLLAALLSLAACSPREQEQRFVPLAAPNSMQVQDRQTGLIWRQCPLGMGLEVTSGGARCIGEADHLSWPHALAEARRIAARDGHAWRLPSVHELNSITDDARSGYALDPQAFPPFWMPAGGADILESMRTGFWTSAAFADDVGSGSAWVVDAVIGEINNELMSRKNYVRLVRSDGPPR